MIGHMEEVWNMVKVNKIILKSFFVFKYFHFLTDERRRNNVPIKDFGFPLCIIIKKNL